MYWTHLWERVISVYLQDGLIRLMTFLQYWDGCFDLYQLGFGHFRLVIPGFTTQHYVSRAEFIQEVAPLWSNALGQEMYDGGSDVDSISQVATKRS